MPAEIVGGAAVGQPTTMPAGRGARSRRLAPFLPAGIILIGLFFAPLAFMFVFSFFHTNEKLDIVATWSLQNYANFFDNPTYLRTTIMLIVTFAVLAVASLILGRGRARSGPLRRRRQAG